MKTTVEGLTMADQLKPVGYLLAGGRIWADQIVQSAEIAERRLTERNDGTRIEPLCLASALQARIAELEGKRQAMYTALLDLALKLADDLGVQIDQIEQYLAAHREPESSHAATGGEG